MASAPQSQAFGERFPPAPRSGPGWARGAAPRWVPAAGTAAPAPREGGGRRGGGRGRWRTQAGISLVTIHEGGWERGRDWSKKGEWNQGA